MNIPTGPHWMVMRFPDTVLFWRAGPRVFVHHRNPLEDRSLGTCLVDILAVDTLHTLALGVFGVFCGSALWHVVDANLWRSQDTKKEEDRREASLMHIKRVLFEWYKVEDKRLQGHTLTAAICLPYLRCLLHAEQLREWGIHAIPHYLGPGASARHQQLLQGHAPQVPAGLDPLHDPDGGQAGFAEEVAEVMPDHHDDEYEEFARMLEAASSSDQSEEPGHGAQADLHAREIRSEACRGFLLSSTTPPKDSTESSNTVPVHEV